ncbi:MAG TPA: ATP-binding protein [Solirubrobacteraceae bacterium]|nr:ATP-binding protein [Solirubrobacteraceae bacterium]
MAELALTRASSAPAAARDWLTSSFEGRLERPELDQAKLLVSELVSNSVRHGLGDITVRAELDEERLLVEVMDEGSGVEREIRKRDFDAVGGWGLTIVDAVASRWGIHEGTTHVWFEVERPGPRLGPEGKPSS